MATTIKLKNGSGAPLAGDLVQGEPAFDLTNKRLYTEDSGGTVIEVGTNPTSLTTGTFTSTGIDDNATSTAITIDSSENVGIGTTSPDTLLELAANNNSGAENNTLRFTDISANTSANQALGKIEFKTDDSSGDGPLVRAYIGAFASDTTPSTYLSFATNLGGAGTVAEEAMRINSSGEVLSSASGSWRLRPDANSALAPSYAFNGDGNTGMYSPTSDTLGFSTQGTEKMRIDSSGNVGIGTTSPSGGLHVKSSTNTVTFESTTNGLYNTFISTAGTFGYLGSGSQTVSGAATTDFGIQATTGNFVVATGGNTEAMRIDASGNVGIGTTSPDALIDIRNSSGVDPQIKWGRDGLAHGSLFCDQFGTTILEADPTNVGASSSLQFHIDGTERMRIDSSGSIFYYTGSGKGYTFGASGSSAGVANMFCPAGYTLAFGTNNTERMRIDSSGNVGIGTASPSTALHIDTGATNDAMRLVSTDADVNILMGDNTGSVRLQNSGGDFVAYTGTSAFGGFAETMRIDSSGNVGIGTTSPSYPLQIGDGTDATETLVLRSNDTGNCLIFFGDNSDVDAARIVYEHTNNLMYFSVNGNQEAMRIDSSGNLLVGTTTQPNGSADGIKLNAASSGRVFSGGTTGGFNQLLFFNPNGQVGSISTSGSTTSYTTSSDERLKENVTDAPAGNIDAIQVRSFDWKDSGAHQTYGMVAQELVDVAPEAVSQGETEEDMWGVDYSKLVPMMIKEIQDLKAEVAALKGA